MARILVLDDDASLLKRLLQWMSIAGHEAEGAGDGKSGLRLLSAKPFDREPFMKAVQACLS